MLEICLEFSYTLKSLLATCSGCRGAGIRPASGGRDFAKATQHSHLSRGQAIFGQRQPRDCGRQPRQHHGRPRLPPRVTLGIRGGCSTAVNVPFSVTLLSPAGYQGTVRPVRYVKVVDEVGLTPDEVQRMCFELCFIGCRCTR